MKHRIWELDVLRGFCMVGMVIVHLLFVLGAFGRFSHIIQHPLFLWISRYGGIVFILISGIAVTFSRSSVRRGILVLFFGLGITAVTAGLYALQLAGSGVIIYFGVLHCLGLCMLLWPLCRHLPNWVLAVLGVILTVSGYWIGENVQVQTPVLIPLGLIPSGLVTPDFFPLLPNFGFFLWGSVLGRTLYKAKTTLFPQVPVQNPLLRFFCFCGRHSLALYLLHQPVLTGLIWIIFKN